MVNNKLILGELRVMKKKHNFTGEEITWGDMKVNENLSPSYPFKYRDEI